MDLSTIGAAALLCLGSTAPAAVDGQDWPCFLGPNGNATSNESALNFDWPEDGPPELWSAEVGRGFG